LLKDAVITGAGITALGAAERTYRRVTGWLTGGAKETSGAAGRLDDLDTNGLSLASKLPNGTGLGGFKVGLSADDITAINSQFGGSVSFREDDTAIANAANYDGFIIRLAQ
jgi:hypothetical protein